VYSTPTCPYCVRTKQFLKENNIEFEDIDVPANPEKANEMIEKAGQMGVPVIAIEEEYIDGFDKAALSKALGLS